MRIGGIAAGRPRHIDFLPIRVGLIPEHGSPRFIELVQSTVFLFQEFPECQRVAFGIKFVQLTVQLIVDLPADHRFPSSVMGSGLLHDPPAQFLIDRRIVIVMASCAVAVQNTILPCIEHLRILCRQPCRRRGGRRAEDHLHAHSVGQIQKAVKKAVIELPFPGFDLAPCKFRDPDGPDAIGKHPGQILFPEVFLPVLRVITGTQADLFSIQQFHVKTLLFPMPDKHCDRPAHSFFFDLFTAPEVRLYTISSHCAYSVY